jgi:outer membrane murein-binding lipoprotein Lpp
VISFRYHLVSIIAVFLALALGIVVGTTALNGPITKDLRHQVDSLKSDRQSLSAEVKSLQGQVDNSERFAALYGSQIVKGSLTAHNVLIVGLPGASGDIKDGLSKEVTAAGGKVTGRIQLTSDYTDPKRAGDITSLATGGAHPIGLTYPSVDDAGELGGALLAFVLLGKGQQTDLKQVLAGFSELNMLKVEGGDNVTPATSVLVVASGTLPAGDSGGKTDLALITQLQQRGGHAVVAGDPPSATKGGTVAMVRGDDSDKGTVATVDNADTALGQVSSILALADANLPQPETVIGHYGTGHGTTALFPDPPK